MNKESKPTFKGVLIKGLLLFVIANLLCAAFDLPVGKLSLYNRLLPGYQRFPVIRFPRLKPDGTPVASRTLITNMDMLFSSHVISAGPKPADEFRVILLGDSSVWGALLLDNQTMASQITQAGLTTCSGKRVIAYDLGYPGNSATKDLLILSKAMAYEPDLIIWSFSLQAFIADRQIIPFVTDNADRVRELEQNYGFQLDTSQLPSSSPTLWDRTIIGQRNELSLDLRLHMYEFSVLATQTDDPRTAGDNEDVILKAPAHSRVYQGMRPPLDLQTALQLDTLQVGQKLAGTVPIVFVNEPIYISTGENSNLRYNWLYPRWAYNQYRRIMQRLSSQFGWTYLDFWRNSRIQCSIANLPAKLMWFNN
jgi:hypothetical protein